MRLLQKALTFDDVLLVPAYSNVLPRETSPFHTIHQRPPLKHPVLLCSYGYGY